MMDRQTLVSIADRLDVPAGAKALLWDMDGTLLDTLALDYVLCNELVSSRYSVEAFFSHDVIRGFFALDPTSFWRALAEHLRSSTGIQISPKQFDSIILEYEEARRTAIFQPCLGVSEILADAKAIGLQLAVVSNNPELDVRRILRSSGLDPVFATVVGNDYQGMCKKPAPDTYLLASKMLGLSPTDCVVLEDSLIGAEAGEAAGCYTVGVASGGTSFDDLSDSRWTDVTYSQFGKQAACTGNTDEIIVTTWSAEVSAQLKAMLSAMPVGFHIEWFNDNWSQLGSRLGQQLGKIRASAPYSAEGKWGRLQISEANSRNELQGLPTGIAAFLSSLSHELGVTVRLRQDVDSQPFLTLMNQVGRGLGTMLERRTA